MKRILLACLLLATATPAFAQGGVGSIGYYRGLFSGDGSFTGQLKGPTTPTDCSAPQYSFQGDTDTGAGYLAANQWVACTNGQGYFAFSFDASFRMNSGAFLAWMPGADLTVTPDLTLFREAARHSFWRNDTNAQRASWANTYTSPTNYEAFSIDWQTQANVALVGTRTAATGTARAAVFAAQAANAADAFAAIRLDHSGLPIARIGSYTANGTQRSDSTAGTWFSFGNVTSTATSGSVINTAITPTYNQTSGTAANTDLLINRTETAVGSGAQYLADFQVGGVSQFNVTNAGVLTTTGSHVAGSTGSFSWNSRSAVSSPADGILLVSNNASNGFTRLILGTNDASGVAIEKSGTTVLFRLGNSSNYTDVLASSFQAQSFVAANRPTLESNVTVWSSTATNDDPTENFSQGRVATTDATVTTVQTIAIPATTTVGISCTIVNRRTGGTAGTAEDGAMYELRVVLKNVAGTATEIAAEAVTVVGESQAGWTVSAAPSGGNELIQVTGAADNNITWHSHCRTYPVGS